jgi:hypothetical protein
VRAGDHGRSWNIRGRSPLSPRATMSPEVGLV